MFIDAEALIRYGGLVLVCLVVYCATGLFFCFFLPSGAVLFTAGVLAAGSGLAADLFALCSLSVISSVAGSWTGFALGWFTGPLLYKRKDSRFFRRQHLNAAEAFYQKYGGQALVAGYFLPIIRSFSPVVAGITRMDLRKMVLFSVTGSFFWVVSFILAGYLIGSRPVLKPWLPYIVAGFIAVVTIPLLVKIIRTLKNTRKGKRDDGLSH